MKPTQEEIDDSLAAADACAARPPEKKRLGPMFGGHLEVIATAYRAKCEELEVARGILDRVTNVGGPLDAETAECYFCGNGILSEDDLDDIGDLLEIPKNHKPSCVWREARDFIGKEK